MRVQVRETTIDKTVRGREREREGEKLDLQTVSATLHVVTSCMVFVMYRSFCGLQNFSRAIRLNAT